MELIEKVVNKHQALILAGQIFVAISWLIIFIQTVFLKVVGKAYFIVTYLWGVVHMFFHPLSALLILPLLLKLFLNRRSILNPLDEGEEIVSSSERVRAMRQDIDV